jgi:cytochrome c-type biogenesis protein CcmE
LGGVVQKDSIDWDPATLKLNFRVGMQAEGGPASVLVNSTGAPPQMFQEGIGAVVEGEYDGKMFHADRVMVKHSNEYRAPTAGERPQELYKTLLTPDN